MAQLSNRLEGTFDYAGCKADAQTWAHHKTVEATNYGTRALAVPEELRLQAVKCSEELTFNKSLADAVKYYVDHLRSCGQNCVVTGLSQNFVSRTNKGRSPKYVKDLRIWLRRFEKAFGEQNAATLTTR